MRIMLGLFATAVAGCGSGDGPSQGGATGPCYPNHTCNSGLVCLSNRCVSLGDGFEPGPVDSGSHEVGPIGGLDLGPAADAPITTGGTGGALDAEQENPSPDARDANGTLDVGGFADGISSIDLAGAGGKGGIVIDAADAIGIGSSGGVASTGGTPSSGGLTGTGGSSSTTAADGSTGGATSNGGASGTGGSTTTVCVFGTSADIESCLLPPAGQTITSCNSYKASATATLASNCPLNPWGQCAWLGDASMGQVQLYGAAMDLCGNGKVTLISNEPGPGIVLFSDGKAVGAMTGGGFVASGSLDTITSPSTGDAGAPAWSATDELCLSGTLPALPDLPTSTDYGANWMIWVSSLVHKALASALGKPSAI